MSIKVMNRVWEHSKVGGTELLMLLAIADHAHDDGGGAWPSVSTLARKCRISTQQVIRVVKALEDAKELAVDRGAGKHGTNVYTVLSGWTHNESLKRCAMCDCVEDEGVEFDKHHRVPGDDSTIVDLCRPCHIKIHKLFPQASDKMSGVTEAAMDSDTDDISSDIQGTKVVTPVSPKPSRTTTQPSKNHHARPAPKPSGEPEYTDFGEDGFPEKTKPPIVQYIESRAQRRLSATQQGKLTKGVQQVQSYPSPAHLFDTEPAFKSWLDEQIKWANGDNGRDRKQTNSLLSAIRNYERERTGWIAWKEGEPAANDYGPDPFLMDMPGGGNGKQSASAGKPHRQNVWDKPGYYDDSAN